MKLVPVLRSFSISSLSWLRNLEPTLMKDSLPFCELLQLWKSSESMIKRDDTIHVQ